MQLLKERRIPEPQYEEGSDYAVSRAGAFWDTLVFSAYLQRQHVACTVEKHCGAGGRPPDQGTGWPQATCPGWYFSVVWVLGHSLVDRHRAESREEQAGPGRSVQRWRSPDSHLHPTVHS